MGELESFLSWMAGKEDGSCLFSPTAAAFNQRSPLIDSQQMQSPGHKGLSQPHLAIAALFLPILVGFF